ncbi:MAG: hypothetical protein L0196_02290 [candidate division Zixibacteria bacterium]|nr:hypothetical protein [candidate division Zixibacteria bacterium]
MRLKNLLQFLLVFSFFPSITWGQVVDVEIGDTFFSPKNLTVQPGTTVRWTHMGALLHTTTADDGSWNSGTLSNGQTFQFAFNQLGVFRYFCTFHGLPGGVGQSGIVTVCTVAKGDLNGSGGLSGADIVLLINCTFNQNGTGTVGGDCNLCYADVNCTGNLSGADIVALIAATFNEAPFPC